MIYIHEKAREAADFIAESFPGKPSVAMILGTGLSGVSENLENKIHIPYANIPHFPQSTVQSHRGELIYGRLGNKDVISMAGRFHYYEGYSAQDITFPIRVFKALGIEKLIITNAAGGLNPFYKEGDIIIVKDHINMMPVNPLRGKNDPRLGLQFPDMKDAYNVELRDLAKRACQEMDYPIKEGVYIALQGPSMETVAEYTFLNKIGGDLVGMSTVPEVIVAKHSEIPVLVFSTVSNVCYPPSAISETTVEDVISTVEGAAPTLQKLVQRAIELM